MYRAAIVGTGLVGLLFSIGGIVVNAQDVPAPGAAPVDSAPLEAEPEAAPSEAPVPRIPGAVRRQSESRARGIRLDEDGFAVGYINKIDPHSLDLLPVPDAVVTFIQHGRIVAQAKSGADGRVTVKGLTPQAVYSVFVFSDQHGVCIVSTYVMPHEPDLQAQDSPPSRFVFASLLDSRSPSASGDPAAQSIQMVPMEDYMAAMQQTVVPPGREDARGSGGGGAAGAGYGAAAAAAAAAGWGGGAGGEDNELASPFEP